jgi:hypothetical protein
MTSVERLDGGAIRVGSSARVVQPGQRPTVWTVTALEAPRTFEWETKILSVTLVASHHLVPVDGGSEGRRRCRNELRLRMSGFGSGLMHWMLGRTLLATIETENQGFKRTLESESETSQRPANR